MLSDAQYALVGISAMFGWLFGMPLAIFSIAVCIVSCRRTMLWSKERRRTTVDYESLEANTPLESDEVSFSDSEDEAEYHERRAKERQEKQEEKEEDMVLTTGQKFRKEFAKAWFYHRDQTESQEDKERRERKEEERKERKERRARTKLARQVAVELIELQRGEGSSSDDTLADMIGERLDRRELQMKAKLEEVGADDTLPPYCKHT